MYYSYLVKAFWWKFCKGISAHIWKQILYTYCIFGRERDREIEKDGEVEREVEKEDKQNCVKAMFDVTLNKQTLSKMSVKKVTKRQKYAFNTTHENNMQWLINIVREYGKNDKQAN